MMTQTTSLRFVRPLAIALALSTTLAAISLGAEATEGAAKKSAEAMALLKKAEAAIKKVDSVWFETSNSVEGLATNWFPVAAGAGHITGWGGALPAKFYAKAKGKMPGSGVKIDVEGGGDGDTFYLIDHNDKKGYEDMDPGVMGSGGRALQVIAITEFVNPAPFDDEWAADELALLDDIEIAGVPCHQLKVVYANHQGESIWAFGKEDLLPRQRVRIFRTPQGAGTVTITLKGLRLDPEIDPADYKMTLPEGYEVIDDFAP